MFVLAVLSLPTIMYIALQQDSVQKYLVKKVSDKLSVFLGTSVTLSRTNFDIFNNISLYNLCVHEKQGKDTILLVPELTLKINAFSFISHVVEINKVTLHNPDIHFFIDSTSTINFQFIIDKLTSKDTTSAAKPWRVNVAEVNLKNANFKLKSFYKMHRSYGVDFSDVCLNPLNIKVTGFDINSGVISMNIRNFSTMEKSGFLIKNFTSRLKIYKKYMVFNDLNINTQKSEIHALKVHFLFADFKQFKTGVFGKKVKLDIDLQRSNLSTDDIGMFLPIVKDYHIRAFASGKISGIFSDLKGKGVEIEYGTHTLIKADFNINGLPLINQAFLHVDIKSLSTIPEDIESIHLPYSLRKHVVLPENFKTISYITYRGKFTGYFNDFVAYGTFNTNLGKVESDLLIKPDSANSFRFEGKVKTTAFDIGKFIFKPEMLGRITLNAQVNGRLINGNDINARLDGFVKNIYFKGYNYSNAKVDGSVSKKTYNGSVNINDPHLIADFVGIVDLTGSIPNFNFTANVNRADLYNLNFDKSDSSSRMSVYMTADFAANSIDDLDGEIKFWNSTFQKSGKQIQLKDFLLVTDVNDDESRINVKSNMADVEITGHYHFNELVNSFKVLTRTYMPSFFRNENLNYSSSNNFQFNVNLKNTRQVTDYFVPGLYISKDAKISGTYNPDDKDLNFLCTVPLLQYNTKKWYNAFINGKTDAETFSIESGCNNLRINNNNRFDNLTIISNVSHDQIDTKLRWSNWDSITYKGSIFFDTYLKPDGNRPIPNFLFQMNPSEIVIRDTSWTLKSGLIAIDSSGININNFELSHNDQLIRLFGVISKDKDKTLNASFYNVNIDNINTLMPLQNLKLQGVLNGNAEVSDIFRNPLFHASLKVDSLIVNNEPIGTAKINTSYNSDDHNITIDADINRGSVFMLSANGNYGVESQKLDFDLYLNKFKVDVFEPFVSIIFSDIKGDATGNLGLTGTIHKPYLNGELKLQDASFMVNYLKTKYFISAKNNVQVENNSFLFDNFEVTDRKGNKALVGGKILADNLQELSIDLSVDAENFECLNTTEKDNSMFYGHAFATGNLTIQGLAKSIQIDVNNAITNKNTIIYIPLGSKMDLTESNFLTLTNKHKVVIPVVEQYEIDKATIAKNNTDESAQGFKLNIYNLEVTPDAEAEIVFDQKIGDVIHGSGSGKLTMSVEGGNFNMYGTYNINEGKYLFTMQNVINRLFTVEPGSSINWNGNPIDAIVNISAFYKVNALISELTGGVTNIDKRRIPVECRLFLTDKLMNPTIRYDINLPNSDQEAKNTLNTAINTEEELSRQFLMLLLVNHFVPSANSASSGIGSTGGLPGAVASSSGLEFLSNQLSNMLSQISKDFDIGVNYHSADEVTNQELEVALSKPILNDKVVINGNFDVGGNNRIYNSSSSNFVGEGDVEVKLTENGRLRLKVFNKSNQSNVTELSPYTQGVGVFYKEDFNSVKALIRKYYTMVFKIKQKEN